MPAFNRFFGSNDAGVDRAVVAEKAQHPEQVLVTERSALAAFDGLQFKILAPTRYGNVWLAFDVGVEVVFGHFLLSPLAIQALANANLFLTLARRSRRVMSRLSRSGW